MSANIIEVLCRFEAVGSLQDVTINKSLTSLLDLQLFLTQGYSSECLTNYVCYIFIVGRLRKNIYTNGETCTPCSMIHQKWRRSAHQAGGSLWQLQGTRKISAHSQHRLYKIGLAMPAHAKARCGGGGEGLSDMWRTRPVCGVSTGGLTSSTGSCFIITLWGRTGLRESEPSEISIISRGANFVRFVGRPLGAKGLTARHCKVFLRSSDNLRYDKHKPNI